MAIQKLKNILAFTGLVIGVPVVRAHGMQWNPDRKVIPDICLLDQCGYTVTADDTNVTITRVDGPADVNMLVESWHTIERAFGAASIVNLTPQPVVVQSCSSGGGGVTGIQSFNFLIPDDEGTDAITVPLPVAAADVNYAVVLTPNLADVDNQYGVWVDAGTKLTTEFQIMIGALPTAGDSIDVLIVPYT